MLQVIHEQGLLGKDFKVYGDNENPLFLAKDVAEWIEHSAVHMMMKSVDENEKVRNNVSTPGGIQEMWFLTEDGVYEVLMQSRKPIAKQFKKEVKLILKSIRKNGAYMTEQTLEKVINDPEFMIGLLTNLKQEQEARKKAEGTVAILTHVNKVYTTTEIAKELGLRSANALNNKLSELGIQFKQNGTWVLYSKYADRGYTQIKQNVLDNGKVVYDRKWTQIGREFLIKLLEV